MTFDPAPWRDSMRPLRVIGFDARLLVLAVPWMFFPRLSTTLALVLALIACRLAERRGYRPAAACRAVRATLAGPRRALHHRRYRRFVDFG